MTMTVSSRYLFSTPRSASHRPLILPFRQLTGGGSGSGSGSAHFQRRPPFLLPSNRQLEKPVSFSSFSAPSASHLNSGSSVDSRIRFSTRPEISGPNIAAHSSFTVSCRHISTQAIRPPPPCICGSPGGPPITGPRIKLRDGRHLAYKEHGVPKEKAKYKIVVVHGFGCSKHDAYIATAEAVQELGVYIVSFDRPGYGESDPDPNRSFKSIALDIEELADQLELGSKFYVIGTSMGGQVVWGCLKYIPHRLAGAALLCPVVNYWWPGFPSKLANEAYCQQLPQDQWALRVAHYAPWLVYWWNTQKYFPYSTVAAGTPNLSQSDIDVLSKMDMRNFQKDYPTQQGVFESHLRDMIVGFGMCEFDPMELKNPFPDNEGSVHLWHGDQDGLVPVTLQRYIAQKLPWIRYHEIPNAGHLLGFDSSSQNAILNELLVGKK